MRHHHHHHHQERSDESGHAVHAHAQVGIEDAANYVELLAQALRAGGVTVRGGGQLVALRTADRMQLDLSAGEEGRHSVVRVELRWETPMPEERLEIVPGVEQGNQYQEGSEQPAGGGRRSQENPE